MPWHIQPTRVTARLFAPGASFEHRDPPQVIAQVDLTADGHAYVHATMSRQDGGTPAGAWRELARLLMSRFGVKVLEWEHGGRAAKIDPARAWAETQVGDL